MFLKCSILVPATTVASALYNLNKCTPLRALCILSKANTSSHFSHTNPQILARVLFCPFRPFFHPWKPTSYSRGPKYFRCLVHTEISTFVAACIVVFLITPIFLQLKVAIVTAVAAALTINRCHRYCRLSWFHYCQESLLVVVSAILPVHRD